MMATAGVTRTSFRRRGVAAGLAALAVLALAGVGLAAVLREGPAHTPRDAALDPAPTSTTIEPASYQSLSADLYPLLAQVPGWFSPDFADSAFVYDYAFNGPCSGTWGASATSGHDGGIGSGAGWADAGDAGLGGKGFSSEARASEAAAELVQSLESCTVTAWETQPIAQPGATLASSANGVAWIQQTGAEVEVLQVATTEGPPPVDVQVEVAEWMDLFLTVRSDHDE
jgi:hypothetical protein